MELVDRNVGEADSQNVGQAEAALPFLRLIDWTSRTQSSEERSAVEPVSNLGRIALDIVAFAEARALKDEPKK